jgi:ABC-type lipoprotein release transport system permease subunit
VNLLTTLLLTIAERERDVAVLGAVGATPGQVTGALVSGGALLALLGGADRRLRSARGCSAS